MKLLLNFLATLVRNTIIGFKLLQNNEMLTNISGTIKALKVNTIRANRFIVDLPKSSRLLVIELKSSEKHLFINNFLVSGHTYFTTRFIHFLKYQASFHS